MLTYGVSIPSQPCRTAAPRGRARRRVTISAETPTALRSDLRSGAYYDSIVLMQLQRALAELPGVIDAAVMMATPANRALLESSGLLGPELAAAGPSDLVISVRASNVEAAEAALSQVDALVERRRGSGGDGYRPRSLAAAVKTSAEAGWVLVSVPGRHAARVAHEALDLGRHVFLYSDNVALDDEIALKRKGAERGLLVMGPDCGTAIVGGVGLGFANRVRRGPVGLVAASGTGLQLVSSRLHELGSGVSQALGTGGRDLSAEVGAVTARQGLALLGRDPETRALVVISKPPAPAVAARLLAEARGLGKPVVVAFVGSTPPFERLGPLHFARHLGHAAELAAELAEVPDAPAEPTPPLAQGRLWLRGLFAGGTLAVEVLHALGGWLEGVRSNVPLHPAQRLDPGDRVGVGRGHLVLDLGSDEFTVGRLHPMIDQEMRLRQLRLEAEDPEVALVLLDVVLGDGAHPDPASELAPAITAVREGGGPEVVVLVVGTDSDPQGLDDQVERLEAAGAQVFRDLGPVVAHVVSRLAPAGAETLPPVDLAGLQQPLAAIQVGLETFHASLLAQGARSLHVDWRPPAGGSDKLAALLDKMRKQP